MKKIKILTKILDIIYPKVCYICGRKAEDGLCKKCEKLLEKQTAYGIDNYKDDSNTFFDKHIYLYTYDGLIRNLILKFKFNDKPYLYKIFIKNLKNNKKICLLFKKYDIIIPVPISKKREKERGYNQSLLISKELSNLYNIYCDNNILIKTKNTKPQSILKKEQRIENAKNVYYIVNNKKIKNKRVLLIDDIFTTGSTVNECSKILKINRSSIC